MIRHTCLAALLPQSCSVNLPLLLFLDVAVQCKGVVVVSEPICILLAARAVCQAVILCTTAHDFPVVPWWHIPYQRRGGLKHHPTKPRPPF